MARRSVCEAGQERLWCCQYCDGDAILAATAAGATRCTGLNRDSTIYLLRPGSWHLCVRDGALPEAAWISHICISRTDRRHQGSFGKGSATDRCPEAFDRGRNAALCCSGGIGPRCTSRVEERSRTAKVTEANAIRFRKRMEGYWQLDATGSTARKRPGFVSSIVFAVTLVISLTCFGQKSPASGSEPSRIQQLFSEEKWQEVIATTEGISSRGAELNYYFGVALAQMGRLDEARASLREGYRARPDDIRFPTELAGLAFKQKNYSESAEYARRALRIDPRDSYLNDFLGTVYFLEGNTDAAVKYWNRVDKPQIVDLTVDRKMSVKPALLDRAMTFSPASELRLGNLRTSNVRVDGLGIFHTHHFQLSARDDGKFDLALIAQERDGWGSNTWQALLSTFRGVFYETVYPEYFNFHGTAINFTSMLRWDSEKRRATATVSGPLRGNPKRRYSFNVDLRNENWDIRQSFQGPSPLLGALNLRRESAGADLTSFTSGKWTWSTGVELSHRDYRNVFAGTALTPDVLLQGIELKALAHTRYELWRVPERRFSTIVAGSTQVGRIWAEPSAAFGKLRGFIEARWYPRAEGDDYEISERISGGGIAGDVPFDELYMLGLERDNDLLLRAHIGTRDGRKGSAPLGRRYVLSNAEINKNLYNNGLFSVRLAPFLDTGKITDPSGGLGEQKWLWDTGAEVKLRIIGVGFTFTYGKDLRSGNNAFYVSAGR